MTKQINADMIENIKNYSNEIVTIHNFVEAVRKMPGMYIGSIGRLGVINIFREIYQNSIDELMKDSSPCTTIKIYYNEIEKRFIVEDNGRGIPFKDMIRVFSDEHTSSNYNKKDGEFSSGVHGVGSKVSNALSEVFIVKSYILGEGRQVIFDNGVPTKEGIVKIPNKDNKQGTIVEFVPSVKVMGEYELPIETILDLISSIVPLTKIGAYVDFTGIRNNGEKISQRIINEDGIITYLILKTASPLIKPIIYNSVTGKMKAEIAFTYDSSDLRSEDITSFANFCPTRAGRHVDAFVDGLSKYFRDYMNKIYLANNKKVSVVENDIKTGLKCIISVAALQAIFTGQAKEILSNEEIYGFVKYLTINTLTQWSKDNPADLQKLCKYFKEVAEIRLKSDDSKVKLANKYKSSTLSGLPAKYIKPGGKHNLELIICEGDSALGSARNSRDKDKQGLYPIRGKIPNSFTTEKKKFLNNEEINGMINIIGGGWGKNFDITKVKWEKIIFMADADKDGCHIDNLLLKFVLMYMRPLLEAGKVYRAVPPLFGAKKNGKQIYFTDRLAFIKYTQKIFLKTNTISFENGKKLTELEVMNVLFKNIEYTYELDSIANRYAVNPNLLELICINHNNKNLAKVIKKAYRFLEVSMNNNTMVISGIVDSKYQTVFINDQFINDVSPIIRNVDSNQFKYYLLNDKVASIYSLMKSFEKNKPSVDRYKGLGEMQPEQLADSTLHPDGERTLIRYTLDEAVKEIEEIRYLESNRYELIRDITVTRADLG